MARAWCSTAAGTDAPGLAAGRGWSACAAAAAAWATWCLTLLDTAVQVTVPRAASPIAPPTCWPVLSRLEATPESSPRTRVSATSDSGTNSMPRLAEVTSMWPSRPLMYVLCSVTCENQYTPPAVTAAPVSVSGGAPTRPTSCETIPDITTIMAANGSAASPDFSRAEAQHFLNEDREEEEDAEHCRGQASMIR